MNVNRKWVLLLAALALAACGGGGGSGGDNGGSAGGGTGSTPPPQQPPPAGPTGTSFAPFIKTQLAQTSDTSEPVDWNDMQFEFDENENAFDDVLQ
jgi:hypothetical protein